MARKPSPPKPYVSLGRAATDQERLAIQYEAKEAAAKMNDMVEYRACEERIRVIRLRMNQDRPKTARDPVLAFNEPQLIAAANLLRDLVEGGITGHTPKSSDPRQSDKAGQYLHFENGKFFKSDDVPRGPDGRRQAPSDPVVISNPLNKWSRGRRTKNAKGHRIAPPSTFPPKPIKRPKPGIRTDRVDTSVASVLKDMERAERAAELWAAFDAAVGTYELRIILRRIVLERLPYREAVKAQGLAVNGRSVKAMRAALAGALQAVDDCRRQHRQKP